MKYYKNSQGKFFAFLADGSQDHLISQSLMPLSKAEIDQLLNPAPKPISKVEIISKLTVTTQSGKVFDADETARCRMLSAIQAADFLGVNESEWKLADNSKEVITLDELKEAHAMAIQALGQVVLSD